MLLCSLTVASIVYCCRFCDSSPVTLRIETHRQIQTLKYTGNYSVFSFHCTFLSKHCMVILSIHLLVCQTVGLCVHG